MPSEINQAQEGEFCQTPLMRGIKNNQTHRSGELEGWFLGPGEGAVGSCYLMDVNHSYVR